MTSMSVRTAIFSVTIGWIAVASGCTESPMASAVDAPILEAPGLSTRRLQVSGERLLDERGREVVLRGFNSGGRAKMPPFLPFDLDPGESLEAAADDFFGRLADLGSNVVRLTFSWEAFEPTRGEYDWGYLDRYRALLDAADANGIAAIVDFHQDVFASPFCGDGFPLWALGDIAHGEPHYDCGFPWWSLPAFFPSSDVSQAFDRLWQNEDGLADAMEAMWRTVAGELAEHPAVAAFEVINEPGRGSVPIEVFDSTTLPAFYERMGTAIREVAGDVPILWDGRIGSSGLPEFLAPPALPGAVFAPHYYEETIAIGIPFVLRDVIRDKLTESFSAREEWGMPVFLGEFGVPSQNLAKAAYLDHVLDVMDELNGHATMWDASMSDELWNGENFSVLDGAGAEASWAGSVVRAYPRAVSGRIARFGWNATWRRFDLEVVDAGADVTEIYLPARHLGSEPRIDVIGATSRYVPERELLIVAATPGASYRVVVRRR